MNLLTLDFETYFDDEYSLSKMTTEEYVRDPRFMVYCVGIKGNDKPTRVAEGTRLRYPVSMQEFAMENHDHQFLRAGGTIEQVVYAENNYRWSLRETIKESSVLCHHAHFDGLILSHHFQLKPAFWFDTLSMARLVLPNLKSHSLGSLADYFNLGVKTVPYNNFKGKRHLDNDLTLALYHGCSHDVDLTHQIFKKLLPLVPKEELRIIDLTIRMFTEPVLRLDYQRLDGYLQNLSQEKENLLQKLGVSKKDLSSAEKYAGLLRELGVEPPVKESPTGNGPIYAFAKSDEAHKQLLDHSDPRVQMLATARIGAKSTLAETRCARLLGMWTRGYLPVYLKYCGAHTTRWSGGDKMNWQNFPRGSEIRLSIMAPEGYMLVVGDLAQIECRVLNWLAGEKEILDAFRRSEDLYSQGATRFYGRPITKADKIERHLGKTIELGCGYGMGWAKFQATCKGGALGGPSIILSDEEARAAVKFYRGSHPCVTALWRKADDILILLLNENGQMTWGPMEVKNRKIYLPGGAFLDYSNLVWDHEKQEFYLQHHNGQSKIYGSLLVENVVQALSRVILSQAMIKIAERFKIATCTHDEVVCVARKEEAEEALAFVLDILKTPPAWCAGIPLDAEGGYDERYSK